MLSLTTATATTATHSAASAQQRAAANPRLLLLGPPLFSRDGRRRHGAWGYAKLPAILTVLAADGREPVRREWLAALLWPERDPASLRRALFELRRELGESLLREPPLVASRLHLQLGHEVETDLDCLDAAWRTCDAAGGTGLDVGLATEAIALWRGELAAGLSLHDGDDFDLWLMQARARWTLRAVAVASALVEHHLERGDDAAAAAVARLAVDRAPHSDTSRADWWRCLVARGHRALAAADWQSQLKQHDHAGTLPTAALARSAATLGLETQFAASASAPRGAAAPPPGTEALVARLGELVRTSGPYEGADALLDEARARLRLWSVADMPREGLKLARLAFAVQMQAAPWHEPMRELTDLLEALLARDLTLADRLSLTWPLAIHHGWMGRGPRGEVLLRGVGHVMRSSEVPPGARVAFELAMGLCHSCSTGNPEVSLRAARRGLRFARENGVDGFEAMLRLVEANAAVNAGDPATAARALQRVVRIDEKLRPADLAHYHQANAYLRLRQGRAVEAITEAEHGMSLAARLPVPMQQMACTMAQIAGRAMLGQSDPSLQPDLRRCQDLAARIGADGYIMNLHFLSAATAQAAGEVTRASVALREALAIGRRCGVRHLRKLPRSLLALAFAAPVRAHLAVPTDAAYAAALATTLG